MASNPAASQVDNPGLAFGLPGHNPPDLIERLAQPPEYLRNEPNFLGRDSKDHSDTKIERTTKIGFRNAAKLLQ
jgi:hypothetical protein